MKIKKQAVVDALRRIAKEIEENKQISSIGVVSIDYSKTVWQAELYTMTDLTSYEIKMTIAPLPGDIAEG